jgi:4-hydroxy-2-oxoheptanedioate aldolase
MDTGAQGLHVPWINTPDDAATTVQSVKFQPDGRRGLAGSRAASFGQNVVWSDYVKQMNDQTLVVVQVEGEEAVNNLDEILQVEGVDVVFIGPLDLSNSLGIPGQFQDARCQDTTRRIADKVVKSEVKLGIMVPNAEAAKQWQQRGARYITTTFEGLLRSGCQNYLGGVRNADGR